MAESVYDPDRLSVFGQVFDGTPVAWNASDAKSYGVSAFERVPERGVAALWHCSLSFLKVKVCAHESIVDC